MISPSSRKGVATAAILLLIALWALLVASLSGTVGRWPILVQAPFYLFMGIAWIIPLKPLIRWSETGHFRAASRGED
jgi:predicted membrane channel-forming protein YqfA (hemolysin III family)